MIAPSHATLSSPPPAPHWNGTLPVGQLVTIITAKLPSATRSGIGLHASHQHVEGRFHRLSLGSVFQPIVEAASGVTIGHEGFIRCGAERLLSPWTLFSQAALSHDPDWLVALDRLCRTLHAANYFVAAKPGQRLFLSVQPGLVAAVARDHGQVFASILRLLGVEADRVVIQLPVCLNRDPNRLREVGESFLARGFGLALNHGGGDQRWVEQLPLSGPLFLKIDPAHLPSGPALTGLVRACHERGIHTLIKRVETQDDWSSALLARVSHVQGFAVGRPAAEPRPGFFSWIGNKGIAI